MKKILAVFHDNNLNSGATKSFLSNIEYLKQNGYEIISILPKKEGNLKEYLEKIGINVICVYYGGNVFSYSKNKFKLVLSYIKCLIKTIISFISTKFVKNRLNDVDVVYSNTSTIYIGYWISNMLNVKHIWHFREFGLEDQNTLKIFKNYFIKISKKSFQIIGISNAIKKYYSDNYGINNIMVLYNDIDSEYILKGKKKLEDKKINILITGTLCENKGQLIAIKAIKSLNRDDVNLYIAGKNNAYGEYLKKYVKDNKVKNIHFLGLVEDMKNLRKKINISLICASKEAFGRTIIEDMLSDILVIGCNSGAVSELINDNYTGILYEYGNIEELSKKIEDSINNYNEKINIIENAKKFAEQFTEKRTAKEIEKILRRI